MTRSSRQTVHPGARRPATWRIAPMALAVTSLTACGPGESTQPDGSAADTPSVPTAASSDATSSDDAAASPSDSASTATESTSPSGEAGGGESSTQATDPSDEESEEAPAGEGSDESAGDASASGTGGKVNPSAIEWVKHPQGQEIEGPAAEKDFADALEAYNTLSEISIGKGRTKLPASASQVASPEMIEEVNEDLAQHYSDDIWLEGGEDAALISGAYRTKDFVQFDACSRDQELYHHPDNEEPNPEYARVETVTAERIKGQWKVTNIEDHIHAMPCPLPGRFIWTEPSGVHPEPVPEYQKVAKTFDALVDSHMAPDAGTLSKDDAALLTDEIAEAFNKGRDKPIGPDGRIAGTGSATLLRGTMLEVAELSQDHADIDVCWTGDYHRLMPDGSTAEDPEIPLTQGQGQVTHLRAVRNDGEPWRIASWWSDSKNVC